MYMVLTVHSDLVGKAETKKIMLSTEFVVSNSNLQLKFENIYIRKLCRSQLIIRVKTAIFGAQETKSVIIQDNLLPSSRKLSILLIDHALLSIIFFLLGDFSVSAPLVGSQNTF